MTTSDREMPAANRAASEIDFVLRRAKWRRGPDVLRDIARARNSAGEAADRESRPPVKARRSQTGKREP